MQIKPLHLWLALSYIPVFIWSAINPNDRFTWFLEIIPGILAIIAILATYKRFQFSDMSYVLMWIYLLILSVGAKYTYSEVPLFDAIRDYFHHTRNNYDKVAHFYQGFGPAMMMREIYLRFHAVKRGFWMKSAIILVLLGIGAIYEIIEWWIAVISGKSSDLFIGSQGYIWDTQSDLLACLIGAVLSILLLPRLHNWSMQKSGIKIKKLEDKIN